MPWILGFDLSLKCPAAVALPTDWKAGDWKRVRTWCIEPKAPENTDLKGQLVRYITIADWACDIASKMSCVHVYVEDYGFSKNVSSTTRIRESGGIVKLKLYERFGLVIVPVAQNTVRKFFLGKLPGRKKGGPKPTPIKVVVQDALFNRCKAPKSWGEDVADAFVVTNYGLADQGGVGLTLAE